MQTARQHELRRTYLAQDIIDALLRIHDPPILRERHSLFIKEMGDDSHATSLLWPVNKAARQNAGIAKRNCVGSHALRSEGTADGMKTEPLRPIDQVVAEQGAGPPYVKITTEEPSPPRPSPPIAPGVVFENAAGTEQFGVFKAHRHGFDSKQALQDRDGNLVTEIAVLRLLVSPAIEPNSAH
jgi:hypothetical protein